MTSNQSPETRPPTPPRKRHQNPSGRRRSRIMLWGSLAVVLTGYAAMGAMFTISSVPLWIWALAWAVVGLGVGFGVFFWAWADAYAGTEGRIRGWERFFYWANAGVGAGVGAFSTAGVGVVMLDLVDLEGVVVLGWVGIMAVVVAVSLAVFFAGAKLLKSFNPLHTFLILAGTSLTGLGLGWLIGTAL